MNSSLWIRFTNSLLPAEDDENPFRSMMKGWLGFMIPIALIAWNKSGGSVLMTVGAFIFPPFFAILQGSISIMKYRVHFGDAPLPQSPAHGVVVVSPTDAAVTATSGAGSCCVPTGACTCLGGRRWRDCATLSSQERQLLDKALHEPPLRLLVVGDSLAIGVGTERSCTPLMPEIIARSLSKAMGGRAVYWTCHGEPGASAAWIVRELERGVQSRDPGDADPDLELSESESNSSGEESDAVAFEEWEEEADSPDEWRAWRARLRRHRRRFHPDVIGPYDVAVVLTGPNDLKSALFPFLLYGEDVEFRKQAKERGSDYADELRRVLDVLRRRMEHSLDNVRDSLDHVRDNVMEVRDNIIEQLHLVSSPRESQHEEEKVGPADSVTDASSESAAPSPQARPGGVRRPLIVLPGMPARSLPAFFSVPVRWLAIPVVQIMDNHKRDLERTHPGEVMYVAPPTTEEIATYEEQRGRLWEQRMREDTLLALRDVSKSSCRRIEDDMIQYYQGRGSPNFQSNEGDNSIPSSQQNPPVPPLSTRPGRPGRKVFSIDNAHCTDEGYDFWGRHIAEHIAKNWHR